MNRHECIHCGCPLTPRPGREGRWCPHGHGLTRAKVVKTRLTRPEGSGDRVERDAEKVREEWAS